jgi:hypothetical protein
MTISFDLTGEAQKQLEETARRLNINVNELAAAAVRDLVSQPSDDFDQAAKHVLKKNADLYRRLA